MKGFKQRWGIWLVILVLTVTAGCATSKQETNPNQQNEISQDQQQNSNKAAQNSQANQGDQLKTTYPLTVKDAKGTSFTFDVAPQKIVSLAPSETEGLFALGLDEQIVGVSDSDDYPEAAKSKPKMGGWPVNIEAVVAAKPDLVLAGDLIDPATVKSLTDLNIKVYQSSTNSLAEVLTNIKAVGEITDRQQQADEVVKQMEKERDEVVAAVKTLKPEEIKKVYIEFSKGWTVGKGVFMSEILSLAGGVNVASDIDGWAEINEESIIKSNPDVILFAKNAVDENNKSLSDIIKTRSGWNAITAIKEDRIVGLDDNLLSRPGPRVTQGLIEMTRAIYPQLLQP
jgi:iron complex transport system substrate-binding protein